MSLGDPFGLLRRVCDVELGFQPLNFSIKPVHVANGLARALTRRSYKTDALAKTLRRYVVKQSLGVEQERHPNEEILERYSDAFEMPNGYPPNPQRLSRLRALSLEVLGADGAVFDQDDKSSYTLTNERFVTRDPSDMRAGSFLARLLRTEHGVTHEAADLMLELLRTEGDPWTTLALPLLQFGEAREEAARGEFTDRESRADPLFDSTNGRLTSPTLAILRDCFDRLARFELMAGSKLNSLRRLVLFGCFALHLHAISRWSERSPTRPCPPILLDMFDGAVTSVRNSSRAGLRAAGDVIEFLILECFREEVQSAGTSEVDLIRALEAEGAEEAMITHFRANASRDPDASDALARAMVDAAFLKAREHPIGSLIELGRRSGFLSPWANSGRGGKLQKRYTATGEFLEILVAATVEPDEPLEFPEFLDRLRVDFGIVTGRPQDLPIIRSNNRSMEQFGPLTSVNEEDLRGNTNALRRLLVEIGFGKTYADGRTIVNTKHRVTV